MKTAVISGIIALTVAVGAPQIVSAQGTITYLSNVSQPSTGSLSVGSNSSLAAFIYTGNNPGGYALNSVQLAMTNASGNPNGFAVMLYNVSTPPPSYAPAPGSSLGTLTGSSDPVTAGIYTYTAPLGLTLSPNSYYFIVLSAGTAVANGAYGWSLTDTYSYNSVADWGVIFDEGVDVAVYFQSSNQGSFWNASQGDIQFALDASPVPEPSSEILLGLGGLTLILYRWRTKSV